MRRHAQVGHVRWRRFAAHAAFDLTDEVVPNRGRREISIECLLIVAPDFGPSVRIQRAQDPIDVLPLARVEKDAEVAEMKVRLVYRFIHQYRSARAERDEHNPAPAPVIAGWEYCQSTTTQRSLERLFNRQGLRQQVEDLAMFRTDGEFRPAEIFNGRIERDELRMDSSGSGKRMEPPVQRDPVVGPAPEGFAGYHVVAQWQIAVAEHLAIS